MSGKLRTLIRLRRFRLDEERRVLCQRIGALDRKHAEQHALECEIADEQASARAAPTECGLFYGEFARIAIARRQALSQAVEAAERELAQQREVVQACYRDLRTLELAEEQRRRRAAEETNRRERIVLDEIALQGYMAQKYSHRPSDVVCQAMTPPRKLPPSGRSELTNPAGAA